MSKPHFFTWKSIYRVVLAESDNIPSEGDPQREYFEQCADIFVKQENWEKLFRYLDAIYLAVAPSEETEAVQERALTAWEESLDQRSRLFTTITSAVGLPPGVSETMTNVFAAMDKFQMQMDLKQFSENRFESLYQMSKNEARRILGLPEVTSNQQTAEYWHDKYPEFFQALSIYGVMNCKVDIRKPFDIEGQSFEEKWSIPDFEAQRILEILKL